MRKSAGILLYRISEKALELFLVHPGGPFWNNKDKGAWTIPKGEVEEGEDLIEAAKREFKEETGIDPHGEFIPIGSVKLKSGKIIHGWAFKGDWSGLIVSNFFKMEYPPKSGQFRSFPEVDKAEFFRSTEAKSKCNPAQIAFIERLEDYLKSSIY